MAVYFRYYYYINIIIIIIIVIASSILSCIRHFERTQTVLSSIYRTVSAHHSVVSNDLEILMKKYGLGMLITGCLN
jgi:hypothetical protein